MTDIQQLISAYVKAEPELSHTEIARDILEEHKDINLSLRTLRRKISEYRSGEDEIESNLEADEKYFVKEDIYYINHPNGVVKVPVKIIDKMFRDYSKYGYNLTGDEVIAKYDLKPHEWIAIKNALHLYKTSDIVSPHTKEVTPKEELESLVEYEMEQLFRNKGVVTKQYRRVLEREYKRVVQKQSLKDAELSHLVNEIYENIDIINGEEYIIPMSVHSSRDTGVLVISDLHFGAHIRQTKSIPRYTMFEVEQALNRAAEEINKYGFKKVHLIILGDLIHSFTGEMHHEMWREIDVEEGIGGKLIVNSVHLLSQFSSKITNLVTIDAVDGNHDRHGKERQRVGQELSYIIYQMLSMNLSIEVTFHGKRGLVNYGGINYILSHGEHPFDNKDVYRMVNRFGNPKGFTVVLKGHKHSRMIASAEDNYDNRRMHCPSFFTFDHYTEDIGFRATAGFLVFEPNEEKEEDGILLPKVHDHSIRV